MWDPGFAVADKRINTAGGFVNGNLDRAQGTGKELLMAELKPGAHSEHTQHRRAERAAQQGCRQLIFDIGAFPFSHLDLKPLVQVTDF